MSCGLVKIPLNDTYCIKQGDSIEKLVVTIGDDYSIDLTTSTVKMQLYKGSQRVLDITNDSGITIVSEKVFEIDKIVNNTLPDGVLYGDLQITDANGDTFTYFNVQYTITKQYTV